MIVTQQPSTSTTKLEEGIVDVDGTSNQAMRIGDTAVFQNIARQRFEAKVCTARQDHRKLAKRGW